MIEQGTYFMARYAIKGLSKDQFDMSKKITTNRLINLLQKIDASFDGIPKDLSIGPPRG